MLIAAHVVKGPRYEEFLITAARDFTHFERRMSDLGVNVVDSKIINDTNSMLIPQEWYDELQSRFY